MMPRMSRVSPLASRFSSTSSLVTIADDEMPTAPTMTKASRLPQPSAKPKASPAPTFEREVDASREDELAASFDELVDGELEPEVEEQEDEAEGGDELEVGGIGDEVESGSVGPEDDARDHEQRDRGQADTAGRRGRGRRRRATKRRARRGFPWRQPITRSRKRGQVFGAAGHDELVSGANGLVGFRRDHRGVVRADDRDDRHPRAATDLELRDRAFGRGRVRSHRRPVDEQATDRRLRRAPPPMV